jgi:ABC-type sugar transport system substrate-binding protein
MKRMRFVLGAVSIAAVVGLVACGGDDDSTSSDSGGDATTSADTGGGEARTIYLNQYTREIPYFQEIVKGMQDKADEFGWTLTTEFGNVDPAEQVDQTENAIVTNPDGMVIIPVDEEAISPAMREATAAGILTAAMGDDTGDPDARDFFLGGNYETLGELKAEYIIEQLGGEGKVGIIHGIRGLNFTEEQNKGAKAKFETAPGIEVVDGPYAGGFSGDLGLEATENLLARDSDLDAIYYDNDDLALGGIQAFTERDIAPEDLLVIGTDGGEAALDAVQAGELDYTLNLCGFEQGKLMMDQMFAMLDGGQTVEEAATALTSVAIQPVYDGSGGIITPFLPFTTATYDEEIQLVDAGEC